MEYIVNMATFALKGYVVIVLSIEMPFLIKEYKCLTFALKLWAGVAGLDQMRFEEFLIQKLQK